MHCVTQISKKGQNIPHGDVYWQLFAFIPHMGIHHTQHRDIMRIQRLPSDAAGGEIPCRRNLTLANVPHVPLLSIFYPRMFLFLLYVPISPEQNCEKAALREITNRYNRHCDVTNYVRLLCLYLHHMPTDATSSPALLFIYWIGPVHGITIHVELLLYRKLKIRSRSFLQLRNMIVINIILAIWNTLSHHILAMWKPLLRNQ